MPSTYSAHSPVRLASRLRGRVLLFAVLIAATALVILRSRRFRHGAGFRGEKDAVAGVHAVLSR